MSERWTGFGVSRLVARPRTGDEGGPTLYSEYSLHFKTTLVPRWDGRGQAMDGSGFSPEFGFSGTSGTVTKVLLRRRGIPQPHNCGSRFSHFSSLSLIFGLDDGHWSGWNIGLSSISNDGWVHGPSLLISAPAPAPAAPLIPEDLIKACNITQDCQKHGMRA